MARELLSLMASKPNHLKAMKKILLSFALLAAFISLVGCSKQKEWSHEERRAIRRALNEYRQMIYLEDLTEAECGLFAEGVAGDLEGSYPIYAEFIEMPGVEDTVEMVVVTTIVEELNTDARNMRHLYPYDYLVGQGVLPSGLTHDQRKAFYNCLAQRVNNTFYSMENFFEAILADTTSNSTIAQLEAQCANELFGWTVTITEIVEE